MEQGWIADRDMVRFCCFKRKMKLICLTHEPKSNSHKQKVHIMNKAMKLFMTKGYDGTSINDVYVAAKLTKPTRYTIIFIAKRICYFRSICGPSRRYCILT